ncbi:hypothetical protein J4Q44_G00280090 [Coregonus suidteri]|uniref:Uncharacterized protein n=1 Tax=Coregonus suidteri TaxID=861788 RepID=A0AAN8QKD6_9TELE
MRGGVKRRGDEETGLEKVKEERTAKNTWRRDTKEEHRNIGCSWNEMEKTAGEASLMTCSSWGDGSNGAVPAGLSELPCPGGEEGSHSHPTDPSPGGQLSLPPYHRQAAEDHRGAHR